MLMAKQRKFCPDLWSDVPMQTVNELPDAIDGLAAYNLTSKKENMHYALQDGRKWKKNCPSQWCDHSRVRNADCKGPYVCINESCPYKVQCGVTNTRQFDKNNKCNTCGVIAEFITCPARRYISCGTDSVKVYHFTTMGLIPVNHRLSRRVTLKKSKI